MGRLRLLQRVSPPLARLSDEVIDTDLSPDYPVHPDMFSKREVEQMALIEKLTLDTTSKVPKNEAKQSWIRYRYPNPPTVFTR